MVKSNILIILSVFVAISGIFVAEHFRLYDKEHDHSPIMGPLTEDVMNVEINVLESENIQLGLFQEILIKVKNLSDTTWPSGRQNNDSNYDIHLTYDWLSESGTIIAERPVFTPLPFDIGPREEAYITIRISGIDAKGKYILKFYMVQEGIGKFNVSSSSHDTINCYVGNFGL